MFSNGQTRLSRSFKLICITQFCCRSDSFHRLVGLDYFYKHSKNRDYGWVWVILVSAGSTPHKPKRAVVDAGAREAKNRTYDRLFWVPGVNSWSPLWGEEGFEGELNQRGQSLGWGLGERLVWGKLDIASKAGDRVFISSIDHHHYQHLSLIYHTNCSAVRGLAWRWIMRHCMPHQIRFSINVFTALPSPYSQIY